jgi:glucosamine-phosphate N-acetyltransferase
MSNFIVRKFNKNDICNGFIDTLSTFRGQINLSEEDVLDLMEKREISQIDTYVGLIGHRVIATASILYEQKIIHDGKVVAHIEDVCVHEDYRGNGYGMDMIKQLVKEAGNKDKCYKIILDTKEDEINFYKKAGFDKESIVMRINLD